MKDLIGCFENHFHIPVSLFRSWFECIMYGMKAASSNVHVVDSRLYLVGQAAKTLD